VQEHNRRYKANIQGISADAVKALERYHWPGNVRELRNVIERAILLEETNQLQASSIQFVSPRMPIEPVIGGRAIEPVYPQPAMPDLSLKNSERALIVQALEKTGGNKTKAAVLLGISRDVLRYRMKRLNLDED
jgi:transcriptional regulator with PAS, ATPase and Fis domain